MILSIIIKYSVRTLPCCRHQMSPKTKILIFTSLAQRKTLKQSSTCFSACTEVLAESSLCLWTSCLLDIVRLYSDI